MKEIILNLLSLIFKSVSFLNLKIRSIRQVEYKDLFIISIDNLSFGGTGKTSTVLELGRLLRDNGVNFSIILRGYGSKSVKNGCRVIKEHTFADVGDEALIYRNEFPGSDIYVGKERKKSVENSIKRGNSVVILDDGFQTVNIKKDFSLMLINPLQKYYYLRNFKFMVKNEDIVCFYNGNEILTENVMSGYKIKESTIKGKYNFNSIGFFDRDGKGVKYIGQNIMGFSGVGDNKRFEESLKEFGLKLFFPFHDHHQFESREILKLDKIRKDNKCDFLVCTFKDFVKLKSEVDPQIPLIYLKNRIEFKPDIKKIVLSKINGKKDKIQS